MKIKCSILFAFLLCSGFLFAQENGSDIRLQLISSHWHSNHYLAFLNVGDTLILKKSRSLSDLTFKKNYQVSYKIHVSGYSGEWVKVGKERGKWYVTSENTPRLILVFKPERIELILSDYTSNSLTFLVQKKMQGKLQKISKDHFE
jgi:hypothetical protein